MTEKLKMQTGKKRTEGCVHSFLETPLLVNTRSIPPSLLQGAYSGFTPYLLFAATYHCLQAQSPIYLHTPAGPMP